MTLTRSAIVHNASLQYSDVACHFVALTGALLQQNCFSVRTQFSRWLIDNLERKGRDSEAGDSRSQTIYLPLRDVGKGRDN